MTTLANNTAAIASAIASARESMEDKSDAAAIYTIGSWLSINRGQADGWRKIAEAARTDRERATALENVAYWTCKMDIWQAATEQLQSGSRMRAAA